MVKSLNHEGSSVILESEIMYLMMIGTLSNTMTDPFILNRESFLISFAMVFVILQNKHPN